MWKITTKPLKLYGNDAFTKPHANFVCLNTVVTADIALCMCLRVCALVTSLQTGLNIQYY